MRTDFTDADLTGCRIYGISAWNLKLKGAKQQNLVITPEEEPEITVDKIEVGSLSIFCSITRRSATSLTPSEGKACSC